jgi:AcrR family transcriptional regulator
MIPTDTFFVYTVAMNSTVKTPRHKDKASLALGAKSPKGNKGVKVTSPAKKANPEKRTNDPVRTMNDIIVAATHEFAEMGLAGARIDVIAQAMSTSKRMIYYYFGSKEGLYIAVLEDAYRRIRAIEGELHLDDLKPDAALRKLVAFTVDYQLANPDFIRLVMNENMHRGEYLAQSKAIQKLNVPAIEGLRRVYERGVKDKVFRAGLDPIDLHMSISALSVFNVANKHTFSLVFKRDMNTPKSIALRRDSIVEMISVYVRK